MDAHLKDINESGVALVHGESCPQACSNNHLVQPLVISLELKKKTQKQNMSSATVYRPLQV